MELVNVNNKITNYNVYIGKNIIKDIILNLDIIDKNKKIFIITDENVFKLYLEELENYLSDYNVYNFIVQPGENAKSLEVASEVYNEMLKINCDRETIIISLGGGVVGDLSGFIASTYMRGTKFIQIPTTLLSQVDSSVGGKVAVNFNGYKNLIGNFYNPNSVIIDLQVLQTLNKRQFRSGLGEIVKYGFISEYSIIEEFRNNYNEIINLNLDILMPLVKKSITIKKKIVELDERDNNIRKILNFGHTIGHGIESLENFNRYTHGEAVSLGIVYESKIAYNLGLISKAYYDEIKSIIKMLIKLEGFNENEIKDIISKIKNDKKCVNGKINIILPVGIGKVMIKNDVTIDYIMKILKDGIK